MKLKKVSSVEGLAALVNEIGFLPFFQNEVEGFSLEECVAREYWFPKEGDGVWEWKGPVIRKADCAYGKFFRGKAGFISREWYTDFANYRRDGYDFDALYDDGLARRSDKIVYEIIEAKQSALSKEIKKEGNFKKGGNKGFDSIITRLQMQGYVVVSDFEYERDRFGNVYGWGVARYELPENRFGSAFIDNVYRCEPEESFEKIRRFLTATFPKRDVPAIEKLFMRQSS